MDSAPEPLDHLAAHAHETHAVVVGGGIAGLVAAFECAKVGIRVTLIEASERLGGVIRTQEIAGIRVDLGPEGYSTRGGTVRALVDELGLGDAVITPEPVATWIAGAGAAPAAAAPTESILGIPENPWDERVRRLIGWRGTWRAYLDRLRPPLTIGQERSLGRLVRTRMGERVLDRLVAPLSVGAFAIHPDDVDVEVAAPGLSSALTRTGSLAGAVAQLRAARSETPGPSIESIDGGMSRLVDAIRTRLDELEATVLLGTAATEIRPQEDGRWIVTTTNVESDAAAITADIVILATPEAPARSLLAPVAPSLEHSPEPDRTVELDVVTLVVSSPELDAAPRRTAVYAVPGRSRASALADATARWAWLKDAAPDMHVLRLTFGGPSPTTTPKAPATAPIPPTSTLDDAESAALALSEASALLGFALESAQLRGFHRQRYTQPPPVSALGHANATEAARTVIRRVPGLAVVGAWLSGTGLSQVVPDAVAEAERMRRAALWGRETPAL